MPTITRLGLAQAKHQLELVPWVPRERQGISVHNTGGTSGIGKGAAYASDAGLDHFWRLDAPAGVTANGETNVAGLAFQFRGRAIGILFRSNSATAPFVDFRVDRRLYRSGDLRQRWVETYAIGSDHTVGAVIIDTDLPDVPDGRPHVLEVTLPGDRDGGGDARALVIWALLVDKLSGGYREPQRFGAPLTTQAVPNGAFTDIPMIPNAGTQDQALRGVTEIIYTNTTAAPIGVELRQDGSTTVLPDTPDGMVPANGSWVCKFQRPVTLFSPSGVVWQHKASAAGLNFTPIGEW
jgi:hypothetical protein